ncbi:MAG: peptide deformylase [Candidatus Campbellbacteria bacterium]
MPKKHVLPRTEFGNPVLRKKAKRVSPGFLKTRKFKDLIQRMIYTMRRVGGVGLAAPQIDVSLAIAVMEMHPTPTRPKLPHKGPIVIVNPKITRFSNKKVPDWEGCLSLKGVRGSVPRSESITVSYTNEQGKRITEKASGLWARIFQHEIDHLNGVVYVDRMKDMKTLMTFSEFKKRILKKKKKK